MTDIIKYIVAAIVLAAGIFAYYWFPEYSVLVRTLGVVAAVVISALVFGQTDKGRTFWQFITAARQEARKIVWPTKKETNQTTVIVVIAVIILGLILWGIDSLLVVALRWLTG